MDGVNVRFTESALQNCFQGNSNAKTKRSLVWEAFFNKKILFKICIKQFRQMGFKIKHSRFLLRLKKKTGCAFSFFSNGVAQNLSLRVGLPT